MLDINERGDDMKSITKWLLSVYVAGAIITMGFQIYYRYPACSVAGECGLALAKGVVWSAIWPTYWVIKWDYVRPRT